MKMKHSTEFTLSGGKMSYAEVEQFWNAVQTAGPDCTVTIRQSTYNDGPMGSSTTTYIEVEAK